MLHTLWGFTLKMGAPGSSEPLIHIYKVMWHLILADSHTMSTSNPTSNSTVLRCNFLTRMNNIHDSCWPDFLKVLQKCPGMATISIWSKHTLSRKVMQMLKISIHDNLLLICVFKGFTTGNSSFTSLKPRILLQQKWAIKKFYSRQLSFWTYLKSSILVQ